MLGWTFGIEILISLIPGVIVIIPMTAIGMIIGGSSLAFACGETTTARRVSQRLAAMLLALGLFAVYERLSGTPFLGFDLLLFGDAVRRHPYLPPGRMATNSAVCFSLAGMALIAAPRRGSLFWKGIHSLSAIGLGIAALAILGYLFGAEPLYRLDQAAGMALLTALGFFALHGGIVFLRPERSVVSLLIGNDFAAKFLRGVLPVAGLVPLTLGFVWLRARERNLVSREGAVALFVVLTVGIIVGMLVRSALFLRASDTIRSALLAREAEARRAAEKASESKSTFLATMSHELRTPLNAIMGYASLLEDGIPEPVTPGQLAQVKRIDVSARHLLSLVDDVLTVSHMDVGQQRLSFARVELGAIVGEVIAIAEPLVKVRGLILKVEVANESAIIQTDAARLRQVLLNLIVNAVKFTDRGSVRLSAACDADAVTFVVEDTGIGIAPQYLQKIFEPFWQVEQSTTRAVGGSGLGLSVSRRLVTLLGGSIDVTSTLGEGTRVAIVLPRLQIPTTGEMPRV